LQQASAEPSAPLQPGSAQKGGNEGLLDKVKKSSFKSDWMNDINDVSRSQAMQVLLTVAHQPPRLLVQSTSASEGKEGGREGGREGGVFAIEIAEEAVSQFLVTSHRSI
jgi:hypothetical protein